MDATFKASKTAPSGYNESPTSIGTSNTMANSPAPAPAHNKGPEERTARFWFLSLRTPFVLDAVSLIDGSPIIIVAPTAPRVTKNMLEATIDLCRNAGELYRADMNDSRYASVHKGDARLMLFGYHPDAPAVKEAIDAHHRLCHASKTDRDEVPNDELLQYEGNILLGISLPETGDIHTTGIFKIFRKESIAGKEEKQLVAVPISHKTSSNRTKWLVADRYVGHVLSPHLNTTQRWERWLSELVLQMQSHLTTLHPDDLHAVRQKPYKGRSTIHPALPLDRIMTEVVLLREKIQRQEGMDVIEVKQHIDSLERMLHGRTVINNLELVNLLDSGSGASRRLNDDDLKLAGFEIGMDLSMADIRLIKDAHRCLCSLFGGSQALTKLELGQIRMQINNATRVFIPEEQTPLFMAHAKDQFARLGFFNLGLCVATTKTSVTIRPRFGGASITSSSQPTAHSVSEVSNELARLASSVDDMTTLYKRAFEAISEERGGRDHFISTAHAIDNLSTQTDAAAVQEGILAICNHEIHETSHALRRLEPLLDSIRASIGRIIELHETRSIGFRVPCTDGPHSPTDQAVSDASSDSNHIADSNNVSDETESDGVFPLYQEDTPLRTDDHTAGLPREVDASAQAIASDVVSGLSTAAVSSTLAGTTSGNRLMDYVLKPFAGLVHWYGGPSEEESTNITKRRRLSSSDATQYSSEAHGTMQQEYTPRNRKHSKRG